MSIYEEMEEEISKTKTIPECIETYDITGEKSPECYKKLYEVYTEILNELKNIINRLIMENNNVIDRTKGISSKNIRNPEKNEFHEPFLPLQAKLEILIRDLNALYGNLHKSYSKIPPIYIRTEVDKFRKKYGI